MTVTYEDFIDIITDASMRLHSEMKQAYKEGDLAIYLSSIGMNDLYPSEEKENLYETNPEGRVLIVGESKISKTVIHGCLKEFGIPKERIETVLDYREVKNASFKNLQYNPNYRLILFGPTPHSGRGKKDQSSIITQIENDDGYPKVVRIGDAHGLKITRTSLKRAIEKEVKSGYLAV